jgi:hypothetical protein
MGGRDPHPVNFLKVPVAEADVRFGAHDGLNSDIELGPKGAKPEVAVLIPYAVHASVGAHSCAPSSDAKGCCGSLSGSHVSEESVDGRAQPGGLTR